MKKFVRNRKVIIKPIKAVNQGRFAKSLALFTLKAGVRVTSKEIFLTTFLFVVSFIATELMVSGLGLESPVYKFVFRIFFLAQYSVFIYFMFDYFEERRVKDGLSDNDSQEDSLVSPEEEGDLNRTALEKASSSIENRVSAAITAPAKPIEPK